MNDCPEKKHALLDRELVDAAKSIKILSNLAWPPGLCAEFLARWAAGSPELPKVVFRSADRGDSIVRLRRVIDRADRSDPVGNYIAETAESYIHSAEMLAAVGTPRFTELSQKLYGSPHHPGDAGSPMGTLDGLAVAEHFIEKTRDFIKVMPVATDDYCVLPEVVAEELRKVVVPFFLHHPVEVVIDNDLAAKAAAGAKTIRIRGGTCFSPTDIPELIHHEAFVHTLTMINGREQPVLKSMGLGAPRTTLTQEGLALFAEFITNSIDLSRLRRIALRLKAIQLGLEGADFIDVFRFFLENGQEQRESFHSSMRIFRGGDVRGRVVNTKDVVYLQGFLIIHAFLLKAIQAGKLQYPHMLFSGRLALSDLAALETHYQQGIIQPPLYEPQWVQNRPCLTAFLLHSSIVSELNLEQVRLADLTAPRSHGFAGAP